jgi:hypothetical protein
MPMCMPRPGKSRGSSVFWPVVHARGAALIAFRFTALYTDDPFFVFYCSGGGKGYPRVLARLLCMAQFISATYKSWLK